MEKDRDQRQEAGVSESKEDDVSDNECYCQQWKLTANPQAKCSEEIRRDLRARQRETLEDIRGNALALKMESNEANADKSVHSQVIRAARDRNNNLFKRVRHTRELNLDVEILEERTKMVVEQAQHLQKVRRMKENERRCVGCTSFKLTCQRCVFLSPPDMILYDL